MAFRIYLHHARAGGACGNVHLEADAVCPGRAVILNTHLCAGRCGASFIWLDWLVSVEYHHGVLAGCKVELIPLAFKTIVGPLNIVVKCRACAGWDGRRPGRWAG